MPYVRDGNGVDDCHDNLLLLGVPFPDEKAGNKGEKDDYCVPDLSHALK
ncbi:MAG: hypothetical protein J6T30_06960 [Bacteroidales bacterium]|nr:hypothetical protein [Bacteroidales bacterium]